MKNSEINIRDPFVMFEDGKYYMYGTRAANFGRQTGGFDVYISTDLENWSEPIACFDSEKYGMNRNCNWAPEVHKYKGAYYMFATFTTDKVFSPSRNFKATYIMKSDSPLGPFVPHSDGPITPDDWMCIDGTLYVAKDGTPYVVFCHEWVQVTDGTICYQELSDDLSATVGEPVTIFKASSPYWADVTDENTPRVTDGPYMYRTKYCELYMLWSTFIKGQYAECLVKFTDGEIDGNFVHLDPLIDDDGGHGMIFGNGNKLYLTFHKPDTPHGSERPEFFEMEETENGLKIKK